MMRSPISRPRRGEFSCHAVSRLELCSSPSPKSSTPRHFATQAVESNADASDVWFTHCLPEPYNLGPGTDTHSAARFYRRPYMDALQTSVSVERHFSRIFPAHPRSLASVLIPRPATLAVLLRSPRRTPFGSGFPNKNLPRYKRAAAAQNAGEIFLRSLHRNHAFGLGSGAHSHPTTHRTCVEDPGISRRFAQECPEGNPGKFNQEKLTWHFTKIA